MSAGMLVTSTAELIEHGLPPGTPAALVENGTTDRQRVLHATLGTIASDAAAANVAAPAMLFVGETAAFRSRPAALAGTV